jgi:glycosyltransferase involved in cell wall biosynthesis
MDKRINISKPRIAIIGEYPLEQDRYFGGSGQVCYNLYNELKKNDALQIELFTPMGVRQMLRNWTLKLKDKSLNDEFHFYSLSILLKLLKGRFEVIHFLGFPRKLSFLILLRKLFHSKFLYTANGIVALERTMGYSHWWIYEPVEKKLINKVDCVITVSAFLKERMKENSLIAKQVKVVPNAVDVDLFKPATDKSAKRKFLKQLNLNDKVQLIFTAGGTQEVKGLPFMLEALGYLNNPDVMFLVCGPKGNKHSYITDNPFTESEQIRYIGMLSPECVIRAYQSADIYIHTSKYDTFGLAPLEAMACGCPVIVSDRVGMSDLLENGIDGFVVRYGDSEDLRGKLRLLLADGDLRRTMGAKARETAKQISWERIAREYAQIYKQLIGHCKVV